MINHTPLAVNIKPSELMCLEANSTNTNYDITFAVLRAGYITYFNSAIRRL